MNAHMAVRPSVGGRAPVKPPAQVKEVYSFPLLPLGEIVEVLHELGIVVSEDDLQKPKPDTFRQWCELFVLEILSINKEEIYTPSKAFAAFLGANEELHDDAVPVVHFLRKTNKVLSAARCDEGLSLRDIMKPEKQRVQRVLSALINLYKFRAEKLAWYEENMQKKQASITRKQELAAQIEHLRQAIAAEAAARQAEQPEIEAVLAQTKALEVQRDELRGAMEGVRASTDAQKEQIKSMKEAAAGLDVAARDLARSVEYKKGQLVSSPAKVKAEVSGLESVLRLENESLLGLQKEQAVLNGQLEVVRKAGKDVTKARALMGEAEAEAVKLKRVLKDEKAKKAEAEALEREVEGMRAQLSHAEANQRKAVEKLAQLREDGSAQIAAQSRALDAVRLESAEYTDQAKTASNARRAAENEKTRLEARKEQLIAKHTAEVSDILSSVKHLSTSVTGYHATLFANLGAVNSMAPVGAAEAAAGQGALRAGL